MTKNFILPPKLIFMNEISTKLLIPSKFLLNITKITENLVKTIATNSGKERNKKKNFKIFNDFSFYQFTIEK